jgi:hypothetical protein
VPEVRPDGPLCLAPPDRAGRARRAKFRLARHRPNGGLKWFRRGSELRIIQCKYWSAEKTIHEKHIFQLFGSALEYAFRLGNFDDVNQLSLFGGPIKTAGVQAVLYTSTHVSEVARAVAKTLRVERNENVGKSDYPLVKCNVSLRDSDKIYHLPFDQQYDRVKIRKDKGEMYVYTVAQAEKNGFRRAWRWRPTQGAS